MIFLKLFLNPDPDGLFFPHGYKSMEIFEFKNLEEGEEGEEWEGVLGTDLRQWDAT